MTIVTRDTRRAIPLIRIPPFPARGIYTEIKRSHFSMKERNNRGLNRYQLVRLVSMYNFQD